MILLWGLRGDSPLEAVRAALVSRGAEFLAIDQRRIAEMSVELHADPHLSGKISIDGTTLAWDDISAVYWRTYDISGLPEFRNRHGEADRTVLDRAFAVEQIIGSWMELTDATVVNRPSAMASNGSKPYQAEFLRDIGFNVPATLITTDPDAVRRFWTEKSSIIYKSISGTRSIVSRVDSTHLHRLNNVTNCPTQFQQHIPGTDVRVHVVGDKIFASEVVSDADDYRYAARRGQAAEVSATEVPDDIGEKCVQITRRLGLHLSGIDLRRAPDGRWFCFEVNPAPGFTYYESHTGQPIAATLAADLDRAPG